MTVRSVEEKTNELSDDVLNPLSKSLSCSWDTRLLSLCIPYIISDEKQSVKQNSETL